MLNSKRYILFAAAALAAASICLAAVPGLVNYQGIITGASGPLEGLCDLTFTMYADSTGGTPLWSEYHAGVPVSSGIFNVILGRYTAFPAALFEVEERWMSAKVGSDPEMEPRMRITATPWAMRAAVAESSLVAAPDGDWAYAGPHIYRMTGNVGIGTSTPAYKLDIRDLSHDVYVNLKPQDDGSGYVNFSGGLGYLMYWENDLELRLWNTVTGGSWGGDMAFGTDNAERMRIKANGDIGIGKSMPASKLDVNGGVQMTGFKMPTGATSGYVLTADATGVGTWQAPGGGGSDGDWTISGSNQYSAVPGNVGIGTTSPGSKLTVYSAGDQTIYARATDTATSGIVGYNQVSGDEGRLASSLGGGTGVYGKHGSSSNYGYLGGASVGVYGRHAVNQNWGQLGTNMYGVNGYHNASGSSGALGSDSAGVYGVTAQSSRAGVYGRGTGPASFGVRGIHASSQNHGYLGSASHGAYGYNVSGSYGYIGGDTCGVYGYTTTAARAAIYGHGGGFNGYGVRGSHSPTSNYGIVGYDKAGVMGRAYSSLHFGVIGYNGNNFGTLGGSDHGAYGFSSSGKAVWGASNGGYGVYGQATTGWAGYFSGDVHINGNLSKTTGSFLIDHPLDPENKLLRHMFVESPEALCVYRGKMRLDASGVGTVEMPSYFKALTKEEDATVTLTPIGRPFVAGYEWSAGFSAFTVYGEPGREVSWVAYADRDDPVARQLARPVEEDKGPDNKICERGKLLNPTAYGRSANQ